MTTTGLLAVLLAAAPTAQAGLIKPAGVTASSEYGGEGNYGARRVADGKASTSWVEGDEGSGLGSWVELDLGEPRDVESVRVWGGDWFSTDSWNRANRPKEVRIEFSDGTQKTLQLADEKKMHELKLDKPISSTSVRLVLKGAYSGSTWLDTAIAEIQVYEAGGGGRANVRNFSASTTHKADADGNYDPVNVADGITDSLWCEGSKEGDGTGDWLDFDFGANRKVHAIELINGIATSFKYWMKGNRATAAKLTFSDGSSETIAIKNSMNPQTIAFSPRTTSSVRLTFTEVVKGPEYNDLCIAEAYFK